jgi:hypothetical protein
VAKYGRIRQATDGSIIWSRRFACWVNRTTDTHSELFIGRRKGRPRWRWMDDVADLKVLKIKRWMENERQRAMETGC